MQIASCFRLDKLVLVCFGVGEHQKIIIFFNIEKLVFFKPFQLSPR